MTSSPGTGAAAVILAGGQGSRLGGVRKAELTVGDIPLLARVLAATAAAGVDPARTVVVGFTDLDVGDQVGLVQEDPPGSGPAAALATGWDWLTAHLDPRPEWVLGLACDLPAVGEAVRDLLDAAAVAAPEVESIFARTTLGAGADAEQRTEWLTAIHRWQAVASRIAELRGESAGVIDCSMRRLFAPLAATTVPAPAGSTDDIDTWEDHTQWQQRTETT